MRRMERGIAPHRAWVGRRDEHRPSATALPGWMRCVGDGVLDVPRADDIRPYRSYPTLVQDGRGGNLPPGTPSVFLPTAKIHLPRRGRPGGGNCLAAARSTRGSDRVLYKLRRMATPFSQRRQRNHDTHTQYAASSFTTAGCRFATLKGKATHEIGRCVVGADAHIGPFWFNIVGAIHESPVSTSPRGGAGGKKRRASRCTRPSFDRYM